MMGAATATAVYLGGTKVWPSGNPGPTVLFSDNFNSNSLAAWTVTSGTTASGGQLRIPHSLSYSAAEVTAKYNMADARFVAHLINPETASPYETYMYVSLDAQNLAVMILSGSMIARVVNAGVTTQVSLGAYSTSRQWWQIREAAGIFYFETSPDGITWTTLGQAAHSWAPSACTLYFNASQWQAAAAMTLVVDDVSVLR
mgnify:CR=1 FL=1